MKTCLNKECAERDPCDPCTRKPADLLPVGRARIDMIDGGLLEAIVLVCPKCRTLSLEQAAVSTVEIAPVPTTTTACRFSMCPTPKECGASDECREQN